MIIARVDPDSRACGSDDHAISRTHGNYSGPAGDYLFGKCPAKNWMPMSVVRRSLVIAVVTGAISTALLAGAVTADAHVTVNSTGAAQGGYAVLTFRVPTESDTASTTKLSVALPMDHPLASVSVQPHPGWTFNVTKTHLAKPITTDDGPVTEAVSRIDWAAASTAARITPGEFDQFNVSVGPLPKVDTLKFPAVQTYSDGTVVRWIESAAAGSTTEPEHPAPTLKLVAANSAGAASSARSEPTQAPKAASSADGNDGAATTGIVLGAVGVLLGGAALLLALRRRSPG